MNTFVSIYLPTFILIAGLVDDLKSRKIHNVLVLALLAIAVVFAFINNGVQALSVGFLASIVAILLTLPLVLVKALGAGDMKLLVAFGVLSTWNDVFWIVIFSLFWGAILGLIKAFIDKKGMALLKNTFNVATKRHLGTEGLNSIPFSVALLFGWFTQLTLQKNVMGFFF